MVKAKRGVNMLEGFVEILKHTSGQTPIVCILTLLCVLYLIKTVRQISGTLSLHQEAIVIHMRQVLCEMHKRSQKTRTVSDIDWKYWTETYSVYRRNGGNGVAEGWNEDMHKWRH